MSSPGQVAGATQEAAGQTASTAKDEATQVGSTAVGAATDVAGTAKEQAGEVASEAISQLRDLLDQTRSQVTDQAGGAQSKLGESLRSLSDELRSMGDGSGSGQGPAAELARTLADRGSSLAEQLSNRQPGELVQELRSFAARRPGGFLLGALAAGVVAGRLTRGATASGDSSGASSSGTQSALPRATVLPGAQATGYDATELPPVRPAYDVPDVIAYPEGGYGTTGMQADREPSAVTDPLATSRPYASGPGL